MAVYYTLVVDCGKSHETAERIAQHFRDFQLEPPGVALVTCDIWIEEKRGFWMVHIWPLGFGDGCSRSEIVTPEIMRFIERELHLRLSVMSGYRAALFGREAQEFLELSESPTEDELALVGMIFEESLAPSEFFKKQPIFSKGYKWIPE